MENKETTLIADIGIFTMLIVGIFMCVLWYPYENGLFSLHVEGNSMSSISIAQLSISWLTSLPCFAIIANSIALSHRLRHQVFLSENDVIIIRNCGVILLADSLIFSGANIAFICFGAPDYRLLYVLIGIVGTILGILLIVVSKFLLKAIVFKKENEEIV